MLSSIGDFYNNIKESINVKLPAIVKEVNADGSVDVLVIRNDDIPDCIFPNVPVRHNETKRAYIFLGIAKGDRGLISFCDKSIEGYKSNGIDIADDRNHSLDDGVFELGFYPTSEKYAFPTNKTIEIGNKDGSFKLSVSPSGSIEITGSTLKVSCTTAEVNANQVDVKSPVVNLGTGGQPIARLGDQVTVAGVTGTITSAGVNTSL